MTCGNNRSLYVRLRVIHIGGAVVDSAFSIDTAIQPGVSNRTTGTFSLPAVAANRGGGGSRAACAAK